MKTGNTLDVSINIIYIEQTASQFYTIGSKQDYGRCTTRQMVHQKMIVPYPKTSLVNYPDNELRQKHNNEKFTKTYY